MIPDVILRYSEGPVMSDGLRRSFGVPQDDYLGNSLSAFTIQTSSAVSSNLVNCTIRSTLNVLRSSRK